MLVLVCAFPAYAGGQPVLPSNVRGDTLWEQYKSAFIQRDGRVIDKRQAQISHSEGQGYGLLCSVFYDDRATFHTVWQWTKDNLQSRKDRLFAWAWGKRHDDLWGVIDYNNATDGDLLIAYALLKASAKWNEIGYKTEGLKIIEGIRTSLAVNWEGRTFLLPGYYGFNREDGGIILNPSYAVWPAYRAFAEIDDRTFWKKVYEDSLFLLDTGVFGKLKLPPDWVIVRKTGIAMFEEKGSLFGYESIRTLLYLIWEKHPKWPDGVQTILKLYEQLGYIPLHIDLAKDTISLEEAPAGFYAIYARVADRNGRKTASRRLMNRALEKIAVEKDDYYSMSLLLLALSNVD